MELTTEEKARIFAMYLGQDCLCNTGEVLKLEIRSESVNEIGLWPATLDMCKLILRPLSKVTDEDAIEVSKLKDIALEQYEHAVHRGDSKFIQFISVTFRTGRRESEEEIIDFNGEGLNNEQAQFLISKGYAVRIWPHYKTPIELGLAIERED